ncbi:Thiol-disulfide oxidoreductase ResA [Rubripirellula amarantea]|uniref:Thiol-disulfide oxidoreductase ResA n=1 Tax=Rubripirellula amarantea TaxID=2527999 RepID=A0A5C5WYF9_9BACT|nr:redoxin domain-containing protein [Rubripirellula amarantea]TWT54932.1 Thiol-disulfide oxidoreductase ResA [Rubripirellula amarantea]
MGITSRVIWVGFLLATASLGSASGSAEPSLGKRIESFTLDNCYGKPVTLSDFESSSAIVIVFLGTECPLAKLYGPRLNEIQRQYADRGLQVIGINSNKQDSLSEVVAYVHRHEITFPMLKDPANRVADAMNAQRTPEAFLLDRDYTVRYHGRIDDQYGVGYSKERAPEPELSLAIEALLAGSPIATPTTEVVGCHIGRVKDVEPIGDVTFTKDIAPIFNAKCVNCHREGEIAPFVLSRYEDVLGWEDTILEVIADNRMPPWYADPAHGSFANDARLTDHQRELITTWVDNGMPEGDVEDLPASPRFAVGWQMPQPDQIIKMNDKPFSVPAEGVVDYQHFVVDPGWTEDKYIVASEARPDQQSVVHHILVYVIPPGDNRRDFQQVLAGYAPGTPPLDLHDGIAMEVKAGSKLMFEMHYTPNGSQVDDLSYIGIRFTEKSKVRKRLQGRAALNHEFEIPAGAVNHTVTASYVSKANESLISMSPHMHLRGKSFRFDALFPDGREETLLNVPQYDFNWQLKYILEQPITLPKGTKVMCTAVFDNSLGNVTNPDPTVPVRWGDQSFEEMMIGFMETVPVEDEF